MNENETKEILKKQEETLILVEKLWRAEKWRRFWTVQNPQDLQKFLQQIKK